MSSTDQTLAKVKKKHSCKLHTGPHALKHQTIHLEIESKRRESGNLLHSKMMICSVNFHLVN